METAMLESPRSQARDSEMPTDDVDSRLLGALDEFSGGSMCIGSSTGEIHGLNDRLAAVREQAGISMCFWGAFGK